MQERSEILFLEILNNDYISVTNNDYNIHENQKETLSDPHSQLRKTTKAFRKHNYVVGYWKPQYESFSSTIYK